MLLNVDNWRDVRAEAWELSRVAMVPARWARQFRQVFERKKRADHVRANVWLRELSERMQQCRVPLNSTDDEIRQLARKQAAHAIDIPRMQPFASVAESRRLMAEYVRRWGVDPPAELRPNDDGELIGVEDRPAIARMTCPDWWSRNLRRVHARGLEGEAVRIGFVHRRAACYVSDESFERRQQQKRRNAATLNGLVAENDEGQQYTIAELAALSVANPAIRRGELMTRLAGCELVARELGHVAEFVTLTCPSAYHARLSADGAENPRYAGHTPREAQAYLCKLWSRARPALARRKVTPYGFRIAEPHHDGCPHWHMMLFMSADHVAEFRAVMRRYALAVDADEPGAQANRIKFQAIDTAKGSAVGYVAKYISKNIDGYAIEEDLFGNPSAIASARVEAWASTWGIRQFQPVGGAPVGVWRELRRVKAEDAARAGGVIEAAWSAAQKTETHPANYGEYMKANGGAICKSADRPLALVKTREGERMNGDDPEPAPLTKYGEKAKAAVFGVVEVARDFVVRSRRYVWRIVRGAKRGWATPPWSSVNNCTRGVEDGNAELDGKADANEGGGVAGGHGVAGCASACKNHGGEVHRASDSGRFGDRGRDYQHGRGGGAHVGGAGGDARTDG